jgi:phage recombination protein Bet
MNTTEDAKTTPSISNSKEDSHDMKRSHSTKIEDSVTGALPQLIERALARSGMSYATFVRCVTYNAFRSLVVWSESDLERLLLICESLGLSPTGRDVYAVQQDERGAGALLALSVDGWAKIVNQHPQFDGMEFEESTNLEAGVPAWIRCTIHRKDRRVALSVKEYLCESARDTSAWHTHPRRMLRHKAMVQCARLAFDLPTSSGVYDVDEVERIATAGSERQGRVRAQADTAKAQLDQVSHVAQPQSNTVSNSSGKTTSVHESSQQIEGCTSQAGPLQPQPLVAVHATDNSCTQAASAEEMIRPRCSSATNNDALLQGHGASEGVRLHRSKIMTKRRGPSSTQQLINTLSM